MFDRLAGWVVGARRPVLTVGVLLVVVAGFLGGGVAERLSSGGFDDPNAEASRAADILERDFGIANPNLVLLASSSSGDVDDPEVARAGLALTQELAAEPEVEQVVSYWSAGITSFKSESGDKALVAAVIRGDDDQVRDRVEELSPAYTRNAGPLSWAVFRSSEPSSCSAWSPS